MTHSDTIYALASGAGRAGVAVIRLSGPLSDKALDVMCGRLPTPRQAQLFHVKHSFTGEVLDQALVLWFPAPHSFTGEDCAELHIHGGRAVLATVTDSLSQIPGLRLAAPGEFSRRAFENGKMDLTQAEAIADLVEAETDAQRKLALSQMGGALGQLYDSWRDQLIGIMALVEAQIDFPDEDIPEKALRQTGAHMAELQAQLQAHIENSQAARSIRDGFVVVILGAPNAGKSSLLNVIAQRDVAIVTDTPGTTRDVIEVQTDLSGFKVIWCDTAGLRESADVIEQEGVRRAREYAARSDLRLWVLDAGNIKADPAIKAGDLVFINKLDAYPQVSIPLLPANVTVVQGAVRAGRGVDHLLSQIISLIQKRAAHMTPAPLTRLRHTQAVTRAIASLERAGAVFVTAPELAGEDLRLAARALAEISGRVDVEDILERVFSEFCIGK